MFRLVGFMFQTDMKLRSCVCVEMKPEPEIKLFKITVKAEATVQDAWLATKQQENISK